MRNNYAEIAVLDRFWQQRCAWLFLTAAGTLAVSVLPAPAFSLPASASGRTPSPEVMACVNLASHAAWRITIDYARATVDSHPARIGKDTLSWYDPGDGGHYTLDRASGNLTVVATSSTGGYFLHDRCHPAR